MLLYKPELATEKQQAVLTKILDPSEHPKIPTMTKWQASGIIDAHRYNWRQDPSTDKQRQFLIKHGKWRDGMSKGEASNLIDQTITELKTKQSERKSNE